MSAERSALLRKESITDQLAALAEHSGIPAAVLQAIVALGERYELQSLMLFGSRARGTYRPYSDIDLACTGAHDPRFALDVCEDLPGAWKVDVVSLDGPLSADLRREIAHDAIQLLPSAASLQMRARLMELGVALRGRAITLGRNMHKFENYKANLDMLEGSRAALEQAASNPEILEFVRSGIASKFALQVELAWKVMREMLVSYEQVSDEILHTPRSVIQEAASAYPFIDGDLWMQMLKDRNNIIHRYSGESLTDLIQRIVSAYIPTFRQLQFQFGKITESESLDIQD